MNTVFRKFLDYGLTDFGVQVTAILLIPFAVGSIWYASKSKSKFFFVAILATVGFWLFAKFMGFVLVVLMEIFGFSILPIPGSHLD